MSKQGMLEIIRGALNDLKSGELKPDEFYELFSDYVDDKEQKEQALLKLSEKYKGRTAFLEKIFYEGTIKYLEDNPEIDRGKLIDRLIGLK